jgi:hypothetical protein
MSALVCASPEFKDLYAALEQAWGRLRGLRKCFRQVQRACGGHMPQPLMDKWQASMSLDSEAINLPTDDGPVTAWAQALAKLLEDADAGLPHV